MPVSTKVEFSYANLLSEISDIAIRAGEIILDVYRREFQIKEKSDTSPVTEADEAAERFIASALRAMTPDIPVIAEEEVAAGRIERIDGGRFWLVDPLDGTKEFIARNGEFTVNIALIEGDMPVLGVVHAPVLGTTYAGAKTVELTVKPLPLRVTDSPPSGDPFAGLTDVTWGGLMEVNAPTKVALPFSFVAVTSTTPAP